MHILIWLLFGAVVGWIASMIMKKNHRMGLVANIIVGLVGSFLGAWLMQFFGFGSFDALTIEGALVSIGGAVLLIAIINAVSRR